MSVLPRPIRSRSARSPASSADPLISSCPWQVGPTLVRSYSRLLAFFKSDPHSAVSSLPMLYSMKVHTSCLYRDVSDAAAAAFPPAKKACPPSCDPRLRLSDTPVASSTRPLALTAAAVKPVMAPAGPVSADADDSDSSSEVCGGLSCSGCALCTGP